jgi:hypothetical protein
MKCDLLLAFGLLQSTVLQLWPECAPVGRRQFVLAIYEE